MLNKQRLKSEIQNGFEQIFPMAFAQGFENIMSVKTEEGTKMAKNFGDNMSEMLAEPMAEILASAIDYYVRNAWIRGTLLGIGSPTLHTINVMGIAQPVNGIVPNTLKLY